MRLTTTLGLGASLAMTCGTGAILVQTRGAARTVAVSPQVCILNGASQGACLILAINIVTQAPPGA